MPTMQYTAWATAGEVAQGPVLNENVITVGGVSAQSPTAVDPAGGNRGRRVRIVSDTNCWVTWGDNPTALADGTDGRMIGSENPGYFDIPANQLIAVIQRT